MTDGPRLTTHEEVAQRVLTRVVDVELRTAIGTLFAMAQRMVEEGRVDVVILAARRLVCVYELLVRHDMPPLSGCLVVSDRYLDTNPDLCADLGGGCDVLILDDSVVLGTTLFKLTERIANLVGPNGSVRSRAVCTDEEQVAEFLLGDLDHESLYLRDSGAVHEFAKQIVVALFEEQLPFFADFPVTKPLQCSRAVLEQFLSTDRWHVADVTAPGFDDTASLSLALIPTAQTVSELLSRCAPEAAALIDAVKVRLYVGGVGSDEVRVVAVPIGMVAPATPQMLQDALLALQRDLDRGDGRVQLDTRSWHPEAQHRFLQLYAAVCVLTEVWPEFAALGEGQALDASQLDTLPIQLYFGGAWEQVVHAFDAAVSSYEATKALTHPPPPHVRIQQPALAPYLLSDEMQQMLWAAQELVEGIGIPAKPKPGELTKAGLVFSHAVAAVFGFVNEHYEVPQRREIRALGSVDAYRAWLGDGARRVLSHGITLGQLAHLLLPPDLEHTPWGRSLVSLGVDEGNDLGVMVPVTLYDKVRDLAFRCYRIGETASLAHQPLFMAAATPDFESDHFVAAMLAGGAVGPQTAPVTQLLDGYRARSGRPIEREELVARIQSTLPGPPVERFEGTVLRVEDGVVSATLLSPAQDDQRDALIPIERIPAEWRDNVGPGVRFIWTTFERTSRDALRRTIEIKMWPRPPLDPEQLERNAAALSPDDVDVEPTG